MYLDLYLRLIGVKKNFNLWLDAKCRKSSSNRKNTPGRFYY